MAKREIELIHKGTETSNIVDYPKTDSKKECGWCEFSELCWNRKTKKSIEFNRTGMKRGRRTDEIFQKTLEPKP